ncbi:hypothetical protein EON66_00850, partial [archaeon]
MTTGAGDADATPGSAVVAGSGVASRSGSSQSPASSRSGAGSCASGTLQQAPIFIGATTVFDAPATGARTLSPTATVVSVDGASEQSPRDQPPHAPSTRGRDRARRRSSHLHAASSSDTADLLRGARQGGDSVSPALPPSP